MKAALPLLVLLSGCAVYRTVQTDVSYEEGNLKPARQITTKVTAYTWFNAKSEIAKSKTLQTDKTQSSAVGALTQTATNNVLELMREIRGIVEAMPK